MNFFHSTTYLLLIYLAEADTYTEQILSKGVAESIGMCYLPQVNCDQWRISTHFLLYLFFPTALFCCIDFTCSARREPTKKLGHHLNSTFGYPANPNHMAGPGHSPANPHPKPKRASPKIKLLSIVLLVGILNWADSPFWQAGTFSTLEVWYFRR